MGPMELYFICSVVTVILAVFSFTSVHSIIDRLIYIRNRKDWNF